MTKLQVTTRVAWWHWWHLLEGAAVFFFFLRQSQPLFIYLLLATLAYGILVPQPETKPTAPALQAQSLDHWTTSKVPRSHCYVFLSPPPKTRWLQIMAIYSLTILEARSLKPWCQLSQAPSEGSRKESFLVSRSFWKLPAVLGVPWLLAA